MALYERLLGESGDKIPIHAFYSFLEEWQKWSERRPQWQAHIISAFNLNAGEEIELDMLLDQIDQAAVDPPDFHGVLMIAENGYAPYQSALRVKRRVEDDDVAVTIVTPSGSTSDTTPTFSGAAATEEGDGEEIEVWIFRQVTIEFVQTLVTIRTGGTWSVDPTTPLAAGDYLAEARQYTEWGAIGSGFPSTTFTVT
jgi:hypothetical protein